LRKSQSLRFISGFHDGEEEGFHDSRAQEEAEDSVEEESRRGDQEGGGEEEGAAEGDDRVEMRNQDRLCEIFLFGGRQSGKEPLSTFLGDMIFLGPTKLDEAIRALDKAITRNRFVQR